MTLAREFQIAALLIDTRVYLQHGGAVIRTV